MTGLRRTTGLIVCAFLVWAAPARADAVTDWNEITVAALTTAGAGGRVFSGLFLDLAMVHAAIHDGVQAIERRYEPYHVEMPKASGSTAAAAAKAARDVLVNRLPAQAASIDASYNSYLTKNGIRTDDPGIAVGQKAAAGIIALRANDGSFPANPVPFVGGTALGMWRPTVSYLPGPPPSLAPMLTPWYAAVTPFTLTSGARFRPEPPPDLKSDLYTVDYNEAKALGGLTNSLRTPEQTDLAYFWADNYQVLWNRVLRTIATAQVNNIADTARLFALTSFAVVDASITAWDSKMYYPFWRPVTAIQEGDSDGNPRTAGDPGWQPLVNTPNYPDYTSGANNVTAAVTGILELFFGTDRMTFTVTSQNARAVQKTRTFQRFSDAAAEVVDARIYEGIHFRFADEEARKQGGLVAKYAFNHVLRPRQDDDDASQVKATRILIEPASASGGRTFTATFLGSNLTRNTYFDIRFRPPGAAADEVALGWQRGASGSHTVATGTPTGIWTVTGVRAHEVLGDYSGDFTPVSATLTVVVNPF